MRRHSLAAAGEAEALLRRCLDADVPKTGMQCARDIPAHLLDMRRELWPLGDDGRIEVAEAPSSLRLTSRSSSMLSAPR